MTTKKINRKPAQGAGFLSGLKRRLSPPLLLAGGALLLSACTGETSDEIAQEQPQDLAMQQCEVARGGIVGTSTDPIMVDGVETQACLLNTDVGQIGDVMLKDTHNYEPLAWVLDGIYEIGQSKSYATLAELQADGLYRLQGNTLYAREGAVVVVHRNAALTNNIVSVDDDRIGGGEWGGVVVNSIGYHPECGTAAGADNFCNVEGDWGYFGGLSLVESRKGTVVLKEDGLGDKSARTGFSGYAAEAGGAAQNSVALNAAITINAPHFAQTLSPKGSFFSGNSGLELNGGALRAAVYAMGNRGHAIHWRNGFAGIIGGDRIIYHDADKAALKGELSSGSIGEEKGLVVETLTLVDKSLNAGTAVELSGGGDLAIDNVVVQGFDSCLHIGDSLTAVDASNSVFYCGETSAPAADGVDYAAELIARADNVYTLNPDLTAELALDNDSIVGVGGGKLPGTSLQLGFDFRLLHEPCYGVGTPLDETINIDSGTYGICELKGQVDGNLYFDDDINGELVAWRIDGAVTIGSDLSGLEAARQQALLAEPKKVIVDGDSRILLDTGSSLTLNADVAFRVLGTAADPVELEPRDPQGTWGGITINGLADGCASAEVCQLAQRQFVDINYLRLLKAGSGRPALALNQVSAGGQVNHLDVADSASDGLALNGGAVNIDNLLVSGVAGNGVQWSNGYRGTLQYAILQSGDNGLGHALHGRNNAADHDASPRSRPVMANITVKGAEEADTAILLEQGSGLLLYNSVVADFDTCLDIDDQSTADLQHTDPAQIYFDNVVLDCEQTVPPEEEDSGMDYAAATQDRSGVYEVDAVLDSNFVASGSDIPGIESSIDFSLAGGAANYLDAGLGYMGSVRDSVDDWYLGWSDSVGVLLAAECDFKGVLEDDYVYRNERAGSVNVGGQLYYSYFKVCGLRGTITEDFLLSAYTGEDAVAVAGGEMVTEELYPGYTIEREPVPTLWLVNGLVRIGEGHLELTDPAQVEAMKADPVTLGIGASSVVMVSEGGGLHVTRGGRLQVVGGKSLTVGDDDTAGPVNLLGLIKDKELHPRDIAPGKPANVSVGNWTGLIVDGFARNNQCPEADTVEPGSRTCNIRGEFGYHGGYDNDHNSLEIENLHMLKGSLRLNSVGRGGQVENLYFGLGEQPEFSPRDWDYNFPGGAAIDIDGGAVNLRNLKLGAVPGNNIRWNHGYQGTMQFVHVDGSAFANNNAFNADNFVSPLHEKEEGSCHLDYAECFADPAILGRNGDAGQEDALPRSMPTLANITLTGSDAVMMFAESGWVGGMEGSPNVASNMIELSQGSGLYMYNSIVGSSWNDTADSWSALGLQGSTLVDQCISADQSVKALLGEGVVFSQVAFGCKEISKDASLVMEMDNIFTHDTFANSSSVSNSSTVVASRANLDIYYFNWVRGSNSLDKFDNNIPGMEVFTGWEDSKYPSTSVINLGDAAMDYSKSQSVDPAFIDEANYFGALDYFLPIDTGGSMDPDDS